MPAGRKLALVFGVTSSAAPGRRRTFIDDVVAVDELQRAVIIQIILDP